MTNLSGTVAIATLSSRVLAPSGRTPLKAGAIGALKVTGETDDLRFSLHTYIPASCAKLISWVDALVADDPLLVGYRLARTSRLLAAAGYPRHLGGGFSRDGRYEILDVVRGRPTPLSTAAYMNGVTAVDEDVLLASAPITATVAADIALINAVASWVVYASRVLDGEAHPSRRRVLNQLARALRDGTASTAVVAAMIGASQ